jgi:nitrite reductase/ring-hydroxylating ferredoxin subunit
VVDVNINININEPQFFDLSIPTGYAYVIGGSRGIIVYRLNENEFIALERHSPHNVEDNCQVFVKEDGLLIEDPCSGSQWLITDGSIVNGPTAFALRVYNTTFSAPILSIYN